MVTGERIKRRRIELKWSQRELASRMNYNHHSTITKIEAGKVDIPTSRVMQFSEVLGVSVAYLMGWTDEQNPTEENSAPAQETVLLNFDNEFSELQLTPQEIKNVKEYISAIHDPRAEQYRRLAALNLSADELSELCKYAEYLLSRRK